MNWPPDLDAVYKYLAVRYSNRMLHFARSLIKRFGPQRTDVISALHATSVPGKWVECRSRVHAEFSARASNSSVTVLPRVLEKIPVMLFVGDQDLICNYVGVESTIQALHWNGETGLGVSTQPLCQVDAPLTWYGFSRKSRHSPGQLAGNPPGHGSPHATSPTSRCVGVPDMDARNLHRRSSLMALTCIDTHSPADLRRVAHGGL